ncbi:MAG: DUF4412 domain-containing protein [bacterium]|nr:DUF4412 domain-containing protein [bacterium]
MKRCIIGAICTVLMIAAAHTAMAGVFLEGMTTESSGKQITHDMYIKSDRVRIDIKEKNSKMIMIYRQDEDVFWMLDGEERKYMAMTREDLKEMRTMMDEAMKQMEEQLKNLPPEQRAMMESMMGDQMSQAAKEPEMTYKLVGKKVKVDSWTCDHYIGYEDGDKVIELWTVDPKDVKLDAKEFSALESLADFFKELAPDEGNFFEIGSTKMSKGETGPDFYGIPVKSVYYDTDGESATTILRKAERQDLDNSLFEIPEGFEKESLEDFEME